MSHAVAILMLVLPNDWVEGSQCSPPISNDDTTRSAPRICIFFFSSAPFWPHEGPLVLVVFVLLERGEKKNKSSLNTMPVEKFERTVAPSFACIVQLKRAAVGMLMHAVSPK